MTHSLPGCKATAILFVWSQGSGSLCRRGLIPSWGWQVGRAVLPEGTVSLQTCSEPPIPHLAVTGAAWVGACVRPVQLQEPGQIPGIPQNSITITIIFSSFLSAPLQSRLRLCEPCSTERLQCKPTNIHKIGGKR